MMENTRPNMTSLSEFLRSLRDRLRGSFPDTYWISGETAGVKVYPNAIYFDLLELRDGQKTAQIKVSAFGGEGLEAVRNFEKITGQQLVPGLRIGARFRVNFHEVYGLSLVLCEIDAEMTLGGIELRRKATLQQLLQRYPAHIREISGAYWSSNKALPLPLVIQRIAVISSPNAEGYHDFMHTLDGNPYGIRFDTRLFATTVHGSQAAAEIIEAFRQVYESGITFDAIALIRGGGAPGDFIPYDDGKLGAVIARGRFPVITGIGHHNNQGIADLLAAVHEKTPTAAAKFIVDRACAFEQQLNTLAARINSGTTQFIRLQQQGIDQLQRWFYTHSAQNLRTKTRLVSDMAGHLQRLVSGRIEGQKTALTQQSTLIQVQAGHLLKTQQRELDRKAQGLAKAPLRYLLQAGSDLGKLKAHVLALSPQRTLERGFAVIRQKNVILTDGDQLRKGDEIEILLARTNVAARVEQVNPADGNTLEL